MYSELTTEVAREDERRNARLASRRRTKNGSGRRLSIELPVALDRKKQRDPLAGCEDGDRTPASSGEI